MTDMPHRHEIEQIRRMRLVSLAEGFTLVVLVLVAVPLRHLAGIREATSIVGPIHGVAFLLYIWTLAQTISGGDFSRKEIARLAVGAVLPFGAFMNERTLRRKEAALRALP